MTRSVLSAVEPTHWPTSPARSTSTSCPRRSSPIARYICASRRATVVLPVPGFPRKTRCWLVATSGRPLLLSQGLHLEEGDERVHLRLHGLEADEPVELGLELLERARRFLRARLGPEALELVGDPLGLGAAGLAQSVADAAKRAAGVVERVAWHEHGVPRQPASHPWIASMAPANSPPVGKDASLRARILAEENRKWLTLVAVSFGLFMIMLDNTVVNVALPTIQEDLGLETSQLLWVVTGYALAFAALMLTGGKLADLYGRRRIFVLGLVIFTLASLACGLSESGEALIAARIVQGGGAALMNPATLSIIAATFSPHERGMAIGIWAGVSALALAIGPLVGGLLTEHLNWNWIFFVNVPVGIAAIIVSLLVIRESKDESEEQKLDFLGLLTSGIGLFALTYGLIEANDHGWTSALILGSFAVAAIALAAFVLLELHQRLPMLDLTLFKNGTFAGANIVILLVALAMFGVFFFVSIYMQTILGYSAVQAGAAFLPMTILVILIAPLAGKASDRIGSRWLMTVGMTLLGVQLIYLSRLGLDSTFWDLLPGFMIGGIGMALTMTPSAAAAVRSVPVDKSGVGSAVLNAFRQVGGSVGVAMMGAIFAYEAAGRVTPEAFIDGFSVALVVAGLIAFSGAIVAAVLVRPHEMHRPGSTEPVLDAG